MPGRVERRPDGWYDTSKERFVPMLNDIYMPGQFLGDWRGALKRIEDLERRGA